LKAVNLLCEYTVNPIGLDEKVPRLSWEVATDNQGKFQSAYQILVASSRERLEHHQADLWDSGKVSSNQSVNNVYQGKPLQSKEKYFWQVRICDENGKEGLPSDLAFFEMGLLNPEDWQGYWITQGDKDIKGPLFRKAFTIQKDVKRATAYISGLGYYELRLNGQKVGDKVLDPGWTDYHKRILYSTYDITKNVRKGENAIGIMLGNGRYTPDKKYVEKMGKANPHHSLKVFGDNPVALFQVNIEYYDGSKMSVFTDNSWKVSPGPISFSEIYLGEAYDARLEKTGWDKPDYDDSDWQNAVKANPQPKGVLVSQATYPTIKVCKTIYPQKMTSPQPGIYVFDFGQNFAGWVRFRGQGKRGLTVKLRHAEVLDDKGMANTIPLLTADATDYYTFRGEGEEIYEPRFTYHGFRYVEITGFPGTPSLKNVEGRVVHSAVPETGNFFCANDLINQIHKNVLWTQLSNLMSVPTDCCQRDNRMGWLGDAAMENEEAHYNFRMAGFYKKWLADMRDTQKDDGSISDQAPSYWPHYYPADPTWGMACIIIPWYVYLFFNDRRILEENYDMMKKWIGFLKKNSIGNLLLGIAKYGDWVPPWHKHSVDTSVDLVASWFYYQSHLILCQIAEILGKDEEGKNYDQKAIQIKEAFNRRYLEGKELVKGDLLWYGKTPVPIDELTEGERALLKNSEIAKKTDNWRRWSNARTAGSQTSNILPLYLDMVPEDKKDQVLKALIHNITIAHGIHLNTGIIGTRYVMDVLTKNGYADLAYNLLTQTTYPSLGYMIKEGATTIWERWEVLSGASMNSRNHPDFGTVDTFLYKVLAGINVDLSAPGFEEIVIKPIPVKGLPSAGASLDTIRGVISSKWYRGIDGIDLEVIIPGNTKAKIFVPKIGLENPVIVAKESILWEDKEFKKTVSGIHSGKEEKDHVVFSVDPGFYEFSAGTK